MGVGRDLAPPDAFYQDRHSGSGGGLLILGTRIGGTTNSTRVVKALCLAWAWRDARSPRASALFTDSSQGWPRHDRGLIGMGRDGRSVRVRLPAPGGQDRRFARRSSRRDGRAVGPVRRESISTAGLGPRENPGCCSGSPACSCSGSTPACCRRCCSSSRPESRGRGPLTAHHRTVSALSTSR